MMIITAKITAHGNESTVPDNAKAIDADIYHDFIRIGSVTLLPHGQTGELSIWGNCLDHWADSQLIEWLNLREDIYDTIEGIESAVRIAEHA